MVLLVSSVGIVLYNKIMHRTSPYTEKEIIDKTKNINVKYIGGFINVKTKCRWKCQCGTFFLRTPDKVFNGKQIGCNKCRYKTISYKKRKPKAGNSLLEKFPNIAKDWHLTRNIKSPSEVNWHCNDKVWWRCRLNHEWITTISSRTERSTGCPYCCNQKVLIGYNDFVTWCNKNKHNDLLKEWDYNKNKLGPTCYTYGSSKKIWWKCKHGHEWLSTISNRTTLNRNCPICQESKGEKEVSNILRKYNIKYNRQKIYNDLIGIGGGLLRFDFYLLDYNILIEYQGEQHYDNNWYNKESQQKTKLHDALKRKYCCNNNIKLIEISYKDFQNIEIILIECLDI